MGVCGPGGAGWDCFDFWTGLGVDEFDSSFFPVGNPAPIYGSTTTEQVVRTRELVSFCDGCHATDNNWTVALDFSSTSSDPSLVLMPSEIVDDSGIAGQELLAYVKTAAPDLEGVVSNWSEVDFMQTIHTGRDPRGHSLAYGMPWQDIAVVAPDGDLASYYIYLHGLTLTK